MPGIVLILYRNNIYYLTCLFDLLDGKIRNALAIILERAGVNEWRSLAKLHPRLALNALQAYAARSTGSRNRLVFISHKG